MRAYGERYAAHTQYRVSTVVQVVGFQWFCACGRGSKLYVRRWMARQAQRRHEARCAKVDGSVSL